MSQISDEASVFIKNVSHSFDGSPVLNNFTYSFNKNQITAILGKSGSGKSTLLQIINGMVRPLEGDVLFEGMPLNYNDIQATRLKIGYVVQHVGLFPHMSIGENIAILGKISKRLEQQIAKRIIELMDMVNLPSAYLPKFPHELSGGEQQRAGLCRAMLLNPPLLLMDEPFASLDYGTKRRIYRHMLEIQNKESRTVILVTHDWEEAVTLADQFIWVAGGSIKASGDKAELEQVKTDYFAEL